MDSKILNKLNESQKKAVEYIAGPSLVIAGAGSGKTRVLTYKIAHLIDKGVFPNKILALTFTNKAAEEMKERIDGLLGYNVSKELWMGTFHSIFSKILRIESNAIGFTSNFTIYDTTDSKRVIKSLITQMNLNTEYYKEKNIYSRISSAKNNLITAESYSQNEQLLKEDKEYRIEHFCSIYKNYCERCKISNAMDFDDLLLYTNILFKKFKEILEKYKEKFDYILVDEYQDTNFAQYLIIKKLSETHRKLCVVGDDAQSIYSFRGAQIKNILNFKNDYDDYKLFKLEQNYRSTKNIVEAASAVILKNKNQIHKNLFSKNERGEKIFLKKIVTSSLEGYYVAETIVELKKSNNYSYYDFAVLYRTNAQSRIIEEAFRKYNINYKIFGGLSFYQRKEIKDSLAYLRLIVNNYDTEALRRIINYPSRKIGDVTLGKIFKFSAESNIPIWELIKNPNNYNLGITSITSQKLKNFSEIISFFTNKIQNSNAYDIAKEVFDKTGLYQELFNDKSDEGTARFENFQEFLNGISEFSEKRMTEFPEISVSILDYLENIALITDLDEKDDGVPFVSLMTIHTAKGLEFSNVFIVGTEENLFPNILSSFYNEDLEEERRLFYVAMTRAKKNLFISYCESRYKFGNMEYPKPSRFIKDIPLKYINHNQDDNLNNENCFESERTNFSDSTKNNKIIHNTSKTTNKPTGNKSNFISLEKIKDQPNYLDKAIDFSKYLPGTKVLHNKFGEGEILSISNEGNNSKVVVVFTNHGIKTILLKYAKMKII